MCIRDRNDVSGDVLARLPKIKPAIEFEKLNDEVQCFQVSLPEDIKGDDVYLFTIYAISQCILSDYNLSAIDVYKRQELTQAMEARCFVGEYVKSSQSFTWKDWLALIGLVAVILGQIMLGG